MVLNPVISKLVGKLVVLASDSPRRLEILSNAGLCVEVVPSCIKETLDKKLFKAPHEYAVETAKQKALEVARRMPFQHLKTPDMVIGADTIVTVDGMILEKPVDKEDAYRMLSSLSGKEHSVITGVAIVLCHEKENEEVDYQLIDFYEETKVKFSDLSESMLWEYINSGEPMDKAGGYSIQALGGMLVEYVHGDFLNVVGFPLHHFCKQLGLIYNSSNQENISVQLSLKDSTSIQPSPSLPPQSSPLHKVKSRHSDSDVDESSWTLVNSLSSHTDDGEVKVRDSENTTVPLMTSRGQVIELNETKHVDSKREKDLQRIMDLMDGFKASKALFTASEMGVFDLLQSSPGLDAAQVAEEMKASVKGTESLLEACVSLGLLNSKERTGHKPVFENTALAMRFLLSDGPSSLRGLIWHYNNSVWPVFSYLESAVREGANQRERAFGKTSMDVFQDNYYSSEEFKLKFMKAMHDVAKVTGKAVATAFDLSSFKTACDIGGCTGAMAHEFTKAHPGMSVMVFDLPTVVEMSQHFHPLPTDNRVSFVPGDFFKDQLPKADLYILARILHDWPDDKVHILLGNIAAMCTPGCAVLIAETLLDGQTFSALHSLHMIALTDGLERTESRYAELLSKHGFGNMRAVRTRNILDAFMAIKI